jgi:hypothetical protein
MWVKVLDGQVVEYPYGRRELAVDYPNTSFPETISDELLAEFGIAVVRMQDPPSHNQVLQTCVRVEPVFDGQSWVETWALEDVAAEEVEARRAAFSKQTRLIRDYKLSQCDWTQLPDATADKAAWAAYRRALRDIPLSEGFPDTVYWPSAPAS